MGTVNTFVRLALGTLAVAAALVTVRPANASPCQVGENIRFVTPDGTVYAPGELIGPFGVIIGVYWSDSLYTDHNYKTAAYLTSPGGGGVVFLRYTDGTDVSWALANDIWMCANDYSTYFRIQSEWESFGLACRNCGFQLGTLNYNGYKFGLDTMGGNDRVFGGNGDDVMFGSDGNDELNGRGGYDEGYGGNGADTADGTTEVFVD